MQVRLNQDLLAACEQAALMAYPYEACGLLVGALADDQVLISRLAISRNVATRNREIRFEIDPALQLSLQRQLRGTAQKLMGVWHSHPQTAAEPSEYDSAGVVEDNALWLITGRVSQKMTHRLWRWRSAVSGFSELSFKCDLKGQNASLFGEIDIAN